MIIATEILLTYNNFPLYFTITKMGLGMRIHELLWPQDRVDHIHNIASHWMKSKKFASADHLFNVQNLKEKIQPTMSWGKQTQDGIYSV